MGAVSAVGGAMLLFLGTYLHPTEADPNDAAAAFSEYAADRFWIACHLAQLAGFALMVAALLCLAHQTDIRGNAAWSRVAAGGALASLAVATALQSVDGIALKTMVDRVGCRMRQVEVGLASTLALISGATMMVYGVALWRARIYRRWIAVLGWLAGSAMLIGGVATAYYGFSGTAMAVSMPASSLVLLWLLAIGTSMRRHRGA